MKLGLSRGGEGRGGEEGREGKERGRGEKERRGEEETWAVKVRLKQA